MTRLDSAPRAPLLCCVGGARRCSARRTARRPRRPDGRRASRASLFTTVGQLPGVPQRADDAVGRGRLDRRRLARVDDGELGARSRTGRRRSGARSIDHPTAAAEIEDECAICHMPMARSGRPHAAGERADIFRLLPVGDATTPDEHRAGRRRRVVHGVPPDRPERLGTRESFTGGFVHAAPGPVRGCSVRSRSTAAGRRSCGRSTGFEPAEAEHIRAVGGLRDLPHALHAGARAGRAHHRRAARAGAVSRMAAQRVPRASGAASRATCRRCAARRRSPRCWASRARRLARHMFLGGNFFMLRMLNRFRSRARRRRRRRRSSRRRRAHAAAAGDRDRARLDRPGRAQRERARARRRRPQSDRPQAADRLSVAPGLAARDGARRGGRVGVRVGRRRSPRA